MLTDLRKINAIIKPMGALLLGIPSPSMIPQNWKIKIIDLKKKEVHMLWQIHFDIWQNQYNIVKLNKIKFNKKNKKNEVNTKKRKKKK